jgi:hypothetical protein
MKNQLIESGQDAKCCKFLHLDAVRASYNIVKSCIMAQAPGFPPASDSLMANSE